MAKNQKTAETGETGGAANTGAAASTGDLPSASAGADTGASNGDSSAGAESAAAAVEQRAYTVTQVPVRHDGKLYEVGEPIRLTANQADRLGSLVMQA